MLNTNKFFTSALAALGLLLLAACSTPKMSMPSPNSTAASAATASATGVVQAIERVDQQDAGIGVGSVAGVVVGPGMAKSNQQGSDQAYRVTLRMDDGSQQVFATATDPSLRVGERIQIANGIVMHY